MMRATSAAKFFHNPTLGARSHALPHGAEPPAYEYWLIDNAVLNIKAICSPPNAEGTGVRQQRKFQQTLSAPRPRRTGAAAFGKSAASTPPGHA